MDVDFKLRFHLIWKTPTRMVKLLMQLQAIYLEVFCHSLYIQTEIHKLEKNKTSVAVAGLL